MKSLKQKIMVPVVLLVTMSFLLVSFSGYMGAKKIIIDDAELITENKVEKLAVHMDDKLNEWIKQMELLATIDKIKTMDEEVFQEYIFENKELFTQYEVVFIADLKGKFLATNGVRGDVTDRHYFYQAIDTGKSVISEPILSKSTGNPIVIVAVPVKDDGKVIGLIGSTINLWDITNMINTEKFGETGYAFMMDTQGLTIAHPREEFILKDSLLKNKSKSMVEIGQKMMGKEEGIGYYEFEGVRKIVSYKFVPSTGWAIGMTANYNEVMKSVGNLRIYFLIIGVVSVSLLVILLYFITDNLVKPINKLKTYMEIASSGDLTIHADIDNTDEIGVLSKSFNTLIKENKMLLDETLKYDQLKTEFFSNISHELKTPLNIIFSTTQLLYLYIQGDEKDLDKERLTKHINRIKQNVYRLLRLVNNLMDITRIDSGFMKLNLKNQDIVAVVEDITLSTAEYVESKYRTIIFDTDIEEKVMAFDPEKMERIILNLISNAVKFTKQEDKIEVKMYDQGECIKISVRDTGIGIPKEKQEMIFEKFIQAHPLYSRNHEGTGIGLSLVKSLVEMHNGKISIKSEPQNGTEFIIEIPVYLTEEEDDEKMNGDFDENANVENIQIEFSDIYE